MDQEEFRKWLALWLCPHWGIVQLTQLLRYYVQPSSLLTEAPAQLKAYGVSEKCLAYLKAPAWQKVETLLIWRDSTPHHFIITPRNEEYPNYLKQVSYPPLVLMGIGDLSVLQKEALAVVGSRQPTQAGLATARGFARVLAKSGLVIVSGLAVGIDGAAHLGALDVSGKTIAVLGSGLLNIYPTLHRELAHRVAEQGVVLSPFPLLEPPKAANFPQRNGIVSGLSLGVLVVEAADRSGSLITARLAAEQGREVFAIPGGIHSRAYRGCHRLIREGAELVEAPEDILSALGYESKPSPIFPAKKRSVRDSDLVNWLDFEPKSLEELLSLSQKPLSEILSELTILEANGFVFREERGYCRRVHYSSE